MRSGQWCVAACLCAIGCASAHAGVYGTVWVEVDNSVGTIGEAAGAPTELEGVRTFDLYAIVTPDTEIFVADFGYVAESTPAPSMWTTQQVFQHELGGDTRSPVLGLLRTTDFAALEFDTYVGLGSVGTEIVRNAAILGGDWSPALFKLAWYVLPTSPTTIEPSTPDEESRIFLARISVESVGAYEENTSADEHLGGMLFVSGRDSLHQFGTVHAGAGVIPTRNAFEGSEPLYFEDRHDSFYNPPDDNSTFTPATNATGDLNFDGLVDAKDLAILQEAFGTLHPVYDLTGDLLVSDQDVWKLMVLIDPANEDLIDFPSTFKELRKFDKQYRKTLKKALKAQKKAEKRRQRDIRKTVKKAEKEQRKAERQARK